MNPEDLPEACYAPVVNDAVDSIIEVFMELDMELVRPGGENFVSRMNLALWAIDHDRVSLRAELALIMESKRFRHVLGVTWSVLQIRAWRRVNELAPKRINTLRSNLGLGPYEDLKVLFASTPHGDGETP